MPVKLVTGPINSGKTSLALKLLAECEPGRTGMIVTPDRATAAELRRRFASTRKGPWRAIRSDAIEDWAGFTRRLASPSLPVATRQHSLLVVLGLIGRTKLSHFGRAAGSYSMAESFARTILALKENLIGPSELAGLIAEIGEPCLRERDLAAVYKAYDKEISRLGLLDEGDITMLAAKCALERETPPARMRTIIFDEFAMPTPAQIAVVRALAAGRDGADITITCPAASSEEERAFAGWLERARETWLAAADEERSLDPAPKRKPCRVEVVKAATPAQEARHAALISGCGSPAAKDCVLAARSGDSFVEWFLSEAHSMGLLPEHPTLDGATGSPLAHDLLSAACMDTLPTRAPIAEFVSLVRKTARLKERAAPWIRALKERRGRGRVAARSLAAAAAIGESLSALAAAGGVTGGAKISREQFGRIFAGDLGMRRARATMIEAVLPFRMHPLGTPLACGAARVIVPRMIEGSFPARSGEGLFFADWKEEALRRIFADAEDSHSRESYAFETMLKKCGTQMTLLFPAVTDSGSETIPSPFVDRFTGPDAGPRALAPCVIGSRPDGLSRQRTEHLAEVELARRDRGDPADSPHAEYLGILRSPEARRIVKERLTSSEQSPTALERYAKCPFSFFAQDILRAKAPPDETPQIRPPDRGKLVHEILARYYRDSGPFDAAEGRLGTRDPSTLLRAGPGFRIEKGTDKVLKKIAEEIWRENEAELGYVKAGLKEREIEEAASMALMVIRAEGDEAARVSSPLSPFEFEWEFSKAKGNPLEIEVRGQKPLTIRGRVDRIDADAENERFLVIDYKTGREEQVSGRIESGAHLQLPLYVSAVKASLLPRATPLGALMIETREISPSCDGKKTCGKTKGLVLKEFDGSFYSVGRAHSKVDAARLDELLLAARQRAAEFARSMREGVFPASNEADCERCDYGDICRHKKVSAD